MPFPRESARKGGQAPATASQKAAAAAWAKANQPWKRSTGPKTQSGKLISGFNAQKGIIRTVLQSWKFPSAAEYEAAIAQVEAVIDRFEKLLDEGEAAFTFTSRKQWGAVDKGDWCKISCSIAIEQEELPSDRAVEARTLWERLKAIKMPLALLHQGG